MDTTKDMKLAGLKDYIDTRDQLLEALQHNPKHEVAYEVTKYCTMPVGESKELKEYIPLKPKQHISITWQYDSSNLEETPVPISVNFKFMAEQSTFDLFYTGEKMRKWISTNAFEPTQRY